MEPYIGNSKVSLPWWLFGPPLLALARAGAGWHCREGWGNPNWAHTLHLLAPTDDLYPKIYHSCFFIVTYLAPLGLMAMAYFQIFRKLWGRQVRPSLVSLSGLGGDGVLV